MIKNKKNIVFNIVFNLRWLLKGTLPTLSFAVLFVCPRPTQGADVQVVSAGTKSSGLKIKSSGVPTSELAPSARIPKLKIGEERKLKSSVPELKLPPRPEKKTFEVKRAPELPSPVPEGRGDSVETVLPAQSFASRQTLAKIPEIKPLALIPEPRSNEPVVKLKELRPLTPQQLKFAEALVLLEMQKNNELALALFTEFFKDPELRHEALLFYAEAARNLGLPKEFRHSLLTLTRETKSRELKSDAVTQLTRHILLLETLDVRDIEPLVQQTEIDISTNDAYNFYRAKYFLEKGDLGQVEDAVSLISESSPYSNQARLMSALFHYRQGQPDKAASLLDQVLTKADKGNEVRTLAALTRARLYFQKNQFKEAFQTYLEVDKSDPSWLQAMVEQSWAQIMVKDYEGAAGNMFSLHSDFFKNAFNPESYVVRTVAYLNLCQFGDSQNVLQNLGQKYAPLYGRMSAYQSAHKSNSDFYETVRAWLKNPDQREVDGLPRSFIVEWARHPAFISLQKNINSYEDEISNFNQVTLNIIQREKEILKLQNELNKELSEVRMKRQDSRQNGEILQSQEKILVRDLASLKYESNQLNWARGQIKSVREASTRQLEKDKSEIRNLAAATLKNRFEKLQTELKALLDQNEVLQYEIYSGAGEHIRYQTAGGEVSKEDRTQLKVEKNKAMKWSFKGEIWEDEIGHFRSSLKNVCPPGEIR
jgi:hypothetical protein